MTPAATVPLSVLDLVPTTADTTAAAALREVTALARAAEELDFGRFWVTEFHGSPITANASPPVLLAHIAAATTRIRVGSGAMLLPYHRPLLLAEQFGTLAALHPGRVDLGIGRGSGAGRETARLLGVGDAPPTPYADRVRQLLDHLAGRASTDGGTPVRVPGDPGGAPVPVYLLGSHVESAELAGRNGLPYVVGHHLAPDRGVDAVAAYRAAFRASPSAARPHTVVCVQVVCGETDDHARALLRPIVVAGAQKGRGEPVVMPSVEQASALPWTEDEAAVVDALCGAQAVGSPATVADRLAEIVARLAPDEIMVTASVPGAPDRIRSLERLRSVVDPGVIDSPRSVNGARHCGHVGPGTGVDLGSSEQGEARVRTSA